MHPWIHICHSAGQFWNIPVNAEPFNGTLRDGTEPTDNYIVTVSHPDSESRRFLATFLPRTWERGSKRPCLYAGNSQAGQTDEFLSINDPIIEGSYDDYELDSPFATQYKYSRFDETMCM